MAFLNRVAPIHYIKRPTGVLQPRLTICNVRLAPVAVSAEIRALASACLCSVLLVPLAIQQHKELVYDFPKNVFIQLN